MTLNLNKIVYTEYIQYKCEVVYFVIVIASLCKGALKCDIKELGI